MFARSVPLRGSKLRVASRREDFSPQARTEVLTTNFLLWVIWRTLYEKFFQIIYYLKSYRFSSPTFFISGGAIS